MAGVLPYLAPFTDEEIQALGDGGHLLRDGLLGPEAALDCVRAAEALAAAGVLKPAGVGRAEAWQLAPQVRGDLITWLDPVQLPQAFEVLSERMALLKAQLNELAYLGLQGGETQLALYPGSGSGYQPHTDAFRGSTARRVTMLYYLNEGWLPGHGGQLRLSTPTGKVDLAPVLDRLVVFRSDLLEHEVLPTYHPRWAVTTWYRGGQSPLDLLSAGARGVRPRARR